MNSHLTIPTFRAARCILAGSILALLGSGAARAADQAWTGGSTTDGSWAQTANWGNNTPPGGTLSAATNTDIATFNAPIANTWGNSAANPVVIDNNGPNTRNVLGINFDLAAGNYFIGSTAGKRLRLTSGGTVQILKTLTATNLVATINAPLELRGDYTLRNDSASGTGAGAGTLNFGGLFGNTTSVTLTLTGSNTNANTIGGVIIDDGGTASVTKNGAGTWVLTAQNSYSGATTVNAGTLTLGFGSTTTNILPSFLPLTLGGGSLQLTGTGTQTVNGLTTTANTASWVLLAANERLTLGLLNSAGTGSALNFNTAAGGANGATVGTGVVKITGQTQGAAINPRYTVSDAGGFGLATVDALNQVIRMAAPTLLPASGASSSTNYHINNNAGGAAAAGSSSLVVTSNQSVQSLTVDTTAAAGTLTLNSGVTLSSDTWNFGGVGANTFKVTGGTGIKALTANAALVVNNYNPAAVTINTPILSNGGDVTVQGTGTVIFSAANTYNGNTIVNGGTLEVATGGSISVGSASVLVGFSSGQAGAFKVSGGSVSDVQGFLGNTADASGTATVSAGTWFNSVNLFVGNSGSGVLNATGGVTQVGNSGTGTVTVASATGSTGTLNLGLGGTAGTINAGSVNGGSGLATVNFNQTGAYAFAPQLTGALKVNKLGSGTTTLTAASTFTGPTTISGGTLALAFGTATTNILPSTTPLTLGNATLQLTGTGTQTVSGLKIASGANRIVLGANETLTLGALTSVASGSALNFNTAAGGGNANLSTIGTSLVGLSGQSLGAVINNQLTVTDAGGFGLASVNGSNQIVRLTNTTLLPASGASSATNYLINNNAGGAAAAGSSTLTIASSESTLSTTVDTTAAAGVVTLNSGVVLNSSIWNFGGANSNTWQITGSAGGAGLGAATFNNFNPGAVTFNTPVKPNGGNDTVVRGNGTLIFSAANSYAGNTLIQGGTLQVTTGGSISVGSASVIAGFSDGDVGTFNLTGGTVSDVQGFLGNVVNSTGTATISSGTWSNSVNLFVGNGGIGVLNLTGTGVAGVGGASGTVTVAALSGSIGTLNLGTGGVAGTLQASIVNGGSGNALVNFNHTGPYTLAAKLSGSLSVDQLLGVTTLTNAETYTGPTAVDGGTLLVDGSLSGSTTTVNTTGTLGGSGSVGTVTVNSGGFLQGGDGPAATGALSSGGNVSLLDGSAVKLTLGTGFTHSSLIRTGGIWSFDNDQSFSLSLITGATAGSYSNIISGLSGSESGLSTIGTWKIDAPAGMSGIFSYNGSGGVNLNVTNVPEPSQALLFVSTLPLLVCRRRRR